MSSGEAIFHINLQNHIFTRLKLYLPFTIFTGSSVYLTLSHRKIIFSITKTDFAVEMFKVGFTFFWDILYGDHRHYVIPAQEYHMAITVSLD